MICRITKKLRFSSNKFSNINSMKNKQLFLFLFLAVFSIANSQTITLPFTQTENKWEVFAYNGEPNIYPKVESFMGKESVLLKRSTFLITKDVDLRDGTIEFDINFPEVRNFPGILFRMINPPNAENFYIGPGNSGKKDAVRYTPLYNFQQAWQLYHGNEYSETYNFKYNFWHHIKIELTGYKAEFYIDDMQKPLITTHELKRGWQSGKIALMADENDLHFANFQYSIKTILVPPIKIPRNGENGLITEWSVSNAVDKKVFEGQNQLSPEIKKKLTWTKATTDSIGILNMSRFSNISPTTNTMIAKLDFISVNDQFKGISFGFSDHVKVFLNGNLIYAGEDMYGSRDDKFLGTIGFFDKLYLPLKKGKNELYFVVTEFFGGWGVKAKFENMDEISLR